MDGKEPGEEMMMMDNLQIQQDDAGDVAADLSLYDSSSIETFPSTTCSSDENVNYVNTLPLHAMSWLTLASLFLVYAPSHISSMLAGAGLAVWGVCIEPSVATFAVKEWATVWRELCRFHEKHFANPSVYPGKT